MMAFFVQLTYKLHNSDMLLHFSLAATQAAISEKK